MAVDLFMNGNEVHRDRGIVEGLQLFPVLFRQQGDFTDLFSGELPYHCSV